MIIYKLQDSVNFLKIITLHRIWNASKVVLSFYLSKLFRKVYAWGYPLSLSIEPTNVCNLGCTECPTGLQILTRNVGKLNNELFQKIINDTYKHTAYLTLYFQGEPYMNSYFFDFVGYARSKKFYVTTSTNGHYLTELNCRKTIHSGLSRLIISIDGTTQEVYEKYRRGGNLSVVIEGVKRLMKIKKELKAKNPQVIIQFIVFRQNEHQINDIRQLAKEMGVDKLAIKTAQIYDFEKDKGLIPENEKFSRYKKNNKGDYMIKNKFYNHCWRSWQSCVITWDGNMIPCCFDKNAEYKVGNVKDELLINVWKSDALKSFKQKLLNNRKQFSMCVNCTEGTKIWI